jgi:hypothetical protein
VPWRTKAGTAAPAFVASGDNDPTPSRSTIRRSAGSRSTVDDVAVL